MVDFNYLSLNRFAINSNKLKKKHRWHLIPKERGEEASIFGLFLAMWPCGLLVRGGWTQRHHGVQRRVVPRFTYHWVFGDDVGTCML